MSTAEQIRQEERDARAQLRQQEKLQRAAAKWREQQSREKERERRRQVRALRVEEAHALSRWARAFTKATRTNTPAAWNEADYAQDAVIQFNRAARRLES